MIVIDDDRQMHILESNAEVGVGTCNKYERMRLTCPYKVQNHDKFTDCWPDNIFHKRKYCDECPDFWKNYNTIVYDGIRAAELDPNSNIHLIRKDIERDGGKYVKMYGDDPVLLLGATSTIEDYYWLYMDKDRNIMSGSCVGGYDVITDEEQLKCMSVVEYLRNNEHDELLKKIENYIDEHKYDKLITKICL